MEVYDFTEDAERAGEVSAEIDYLSTRQLVKVRDVIDELKEQEKEEQHSEYRQCFDAMILPVLKTIAQEAGCILTIMQKDSVIEAYFEKQKSMSLDLESGYRKLIFSTFDYITFEQTEDGYRIVCSFDLGK